MIVHQRMRKGMPRLNAVTASVLAAFSITAGLAGTPFAEAATGAVRSNHASIDGAVNKPDGAVNRRGRSSVRKPPASRPASTMVVTNCNDSGPGSLRQALLDAVDGDAIDLTTLTCSTIVLTSGEMESDGGLTWTGPGRNRLAIDGNGASLLLRHNSGALNISGITLRNGFGADGVGGCTWIGGDLTLTDSTVTGCMSGDGLNSAAYGAGLDVVGNLTLQNSVVSGNTALSAGGAYGGGTYGGGIYVGGNAAVNAGSVVSGNVAQSAHGVARGGGLFAKGNVTTKYAAILDNDAVSTDGTAYGGGIHGTSGIAVFNSTVSGNAALSLNRWSYGGGISGGEYYTANPGNVLLATSTISGNSARSNCQYCMIQGGGVNSFGAISVKYSTIHGNDVTVGRSATARGGGLTSFLKADANAIALVSSTVSGNSASSGGSSEAFAYAGGFATIRGRAYAANSTIAFNTAGTRGGGIVASNDSTAGPGESTFFSTIVASNTAPSGADLDLVPYASGTLTVLGDHNLVVIAGAGVTLPVDTIQAEPKLFPLDSNGGRTLTHALAACSPAIDAGSNPRNADFDQRNSPFVRVYGSAADIGAFERQPESDLIFRNGFEAGVTCP